MWMSDRMQIEPKTFNQLLLNQNPQTQQSPCNYDRYLTEGASTFHIKTS